MRFRHICDILTERQKYLSDKIPYGERTMNISIKKKPLVQTERLTIKPYSAADKEQLAELLTNEEITETFMVPDF